LTKNRWNYSFSAFFNVTRNEFHRNLTITHEVLHLYFPGDHIAILKGLGFEGYTDDRKASDDLNIWLQGDCMTTPTQKP
jgi:hypothetical protein